MKNELFSLSIASRCLLVGIILFFSSCRSYKDLTVLRDVSTTEAPSKFPTPPPPYVVKGDDNLYISIVSSSQEMNDLYNPAMTSSGRTMGNNTVYNEIPGQYIFGYQVDAHGEVTLPLMGKVTVKGLTLFACEEAITAKAKEFLKELTVKVRLLNFRITVMGEVVRPGVYYNYNPIFTVMDAISTAGGITNSSDLQKVLLVRTTPEGSQSYYLDVSSKESLSSPGYYLQPNDIVIIEPAKYKDVQLRLPIYQIIISATVAVLLAVSILTK